MTRYDSQIIKLNPWWRGAAAAATAVTHDPHLRQRAGARFLWTPPALEAIPLEPGSTHTLRGPRQVGKTTTLKSLLARIVEKGERRVLYYSFDLQRESQSIAEVVERAKELHPDPEGPWYLFLDEVTSIRDWQMGLKYLWDQGVTRPDLIVCTGSSARQMGAEQLPGRRGNGRDFVQLPLSFRAFCRDVLKLPLPDETLDIADIPTPQGAKLMRAYNLLARELNDATTGFLEVGGFPAAVQDALTGVGSTVAPTAAALAPVQPQTIRMLWDIVAGDIQEAGRDKHSALKLLERVGVSLGAGLAWSSLREDMDVASHHTAKEYTHLLSEAFMLLTVCFRNTNGGFEPARQRKLYYIDPMVARIAPTMVPGARRANADGLIENLVAVALYRSTADALVLADPLPGGLGYWKSSENREIDFLTSIRGKSGAYFAVEVKGDSKSGISGARKAIQQTFGRGLVVTRTQFDWTPDVPALPLGVFLAALGDRPQRSAASL